MTARVSPARAAELAALSKAATEGPWETAEPGVEGPKLYVQQDDKTYPRFTATPVCATKCSGLNEHAAADAAFIAAARTAVPDLLSDLADARAILKRISDPTNRVTLAQAFGLARDFLDDGTRA